MGTSNPNYTATYDLLRGSWGLISAVLLGFICAHEPPSRREVCWWVRHKTLGFGRWRVWGLGFRV